jgi:histidine ammonia-lyase
LSKGITFAKFFFENTQLDQIEIQEFNIRNFLTLHLISPVTPISLDEIEHLVREKTPIALSDDARTRIQKCRNFLENKLKNAEQPFYGINTGFGSLVSVKISTDQLADLQENLVKSHAVGMGDLVPIEIVRLMLFLKIRSMSYGFSGVREEVIERLIAFYNLGIFPVIYELGSLGASGDLAPLAHLSLPILGLGECWIEKKSGKIARKSTAKILEKHGLEPLRLAAKEGLALLNGTQFCLAYSVSNLLEARKLTSQADLNCAIAMDAWRCQHTPMNPLLHEIRPHAGQVFVAKNILNWLKDSALSKLPKASLQDPYAFRCAPQVHGATRDTLHFIEKTVVTEMNAVTDNPNLFPDENQILSGGNFHAQPLALAMDFLAIAVSELGNIGERRVYNLISGQRGLPPFLTPNAGLHSGLMIAQYTAAAILNQNKTFCTPASVDSIVSSNGQEDHVSMGANAATKCRRVVINTHRLMAIEFMTAMQALDFQRNMSDKKSSIEIETILENYRQVVPKLVEDRVLSLDLEATVAFLADFNPQIG